LPYAWGAAAGENSPAASVVSDLQNALLDAMKLGPQADVQERYAKLAPVISRAYDFTYVTPRVFGAGWQKLSEEQKQTIADLYQRAAIMMYATEFNDYHGEQFVIVKDEADSRGNRIVRTEMRSPGAQTVHFDYQLHRTDDRWSIVNTIFDGVSGLSMDRSRYEGLLRDQGPDALIRALRTAANGAPAPKAAPGK
jgi:phospholipid transport system substrate-binding protein